MILFTQVSESIIISLALVLSGLHADNQLRRLTVHWTTYVKPLGPSNILGQAGPVQWKNGEMRMVCCWTVLVGGL